MQEWNLSDEKKVQYQTLIKSAQEVESNIGSTQYRIHQMVRLREDIDKSLKVLWDGLIKEHNLDPKRDFMINNQGVIVDVTKPRPTDIKPLETVEDLK